MLKREVLTKIKLRECLYFNFEKIVSEQTRRTRKDLMVNLNQIFIAVDSHIVGV